MTAQLKDRATRYYFDRNFNTQAVKVLPNEFYVTKNDIMLTTLLGSCVAACIRDSVSGIGGINHFMLPEGDIQSPASATMRYGAFAMEVLINEILKAGGMRKNLEAKVFGGGAVLKAMQQTNIGERNAKFVLNYLRLEEIFVKAQDLGNNYARRVSYFPRTGQVMVRKLISSHSAEVIAAHEQAVAKKLVNSTHQVSKVERFNTPIRKKLSSEN